MRLKNSDQKNYTVEMWRYARELKTVSPNPDIGHVHKPGSKATLQNVDFSINSLGMRGPEVDLEKIHSSKKVLFLGSSITLGWGVHQDETLSARLQEKLGNEYSVLNAGIGNYNTHRSVQNYLNTVQAKIRPDIVILHYFVNDAELLPPSKTNFLYRNSQLAVLLYYLAQGLIRDGSDLSTLIDHYREVYNPKSEGYQLMVKALDDLDASADKNHVRIILAMMPDVHQLQDYPFTFIHKEMRALAKDRGWGYVELLDGLEDFEGPELWTIPGDPHPNAQVHEIMADMLATEIKN